MKKRLKFVLAFVMIAILVSILAAYAFATTDTQNGLEATIVTDKKDYASGDNIFVEVTVKNSNDYIVKNVSIDGILPQELRPKDNISLKTEDVALQPDGIIKLSFVSVFSQPEKKAETSDTVPIGSNTSPVYKIKQSEALSKTIIVACCVLAGISAVGIVLVSLALKRRKNVGRLVIIIVCFAMLFLAIVGLILFTVYSKDRSNYFLISEAITIDGDSYNISAKINYDVKETASKNGFTNAELKQAEKFECDLDETLKGYLQSDGYIDKNSIPKCLSEVCNFCEDQKNIIKLYDYDSKNESVYIELKSGMIYLIVPPVKDRLSGGETREIITFEPNKKSIQNFLSKTVLGSKYKSVSDTAEFVDTHSENLRFDNSLENEKVSIDKLKELSSFKLMLWNGHGAYNENKNILALSTGTKVSRKNDKKYSSDIENGRIVKMGFVKKKYGITSEFVDKYFPEAENAIVYLGACYSCINSSLSSSFFRKGAAAVLGYDISVNPDVEVQIRSFLFSDLCERLNNKKYRSVLEAYDLRAGDYAKNGFVLRANNGNVCLVGTITSEESNTPIEMTDFIGITVDKLCEVYGTDFEVGYADYTMDGESTTRRIYYNDNRTPLEFTVSAEGQHTDEPSRSEITGKEIIYKIKMLKPGRENSIVVNGGLNTNTTYSQLSSTKGTRYIYDLTGPFYEEGFVYSIETQNAFVEFYYNEFPNENFIADKIVVHSKDTEWQMPDDNWGVKNVVDFTSGSSIIPFTVTGVVKTIEMEHPNNASTISSTVIYLDKPIKRISNNFEYQEVKYVGLYISEDMKQYRRLNLPQDGTRVTVTGEVWEGLTAYQQEVMITAMLIKEY